MYETDARAHIDTVWRNTGQPIHIHTNKSHDYVQIHMQTCFVQTDETSYTQLLSLCCADPHSYFQASPEDLVWSLVNSVCSDTCSHLKEINEITVITISTGITKNTKDLNFRPRTLRL